MIFLLLLLIPIIILWVLFQASGIIILILAVFLGLAFSDKSIENKLKIQIEKNIKGTGQKISVIIKKDNELEKNGTVNEKLKNFIIVANIDGEDFQTEIDSKIDTSVKPNFSATQIERIVHNICTKYNNSIESGTSKNNI